MELLPLEITDSIAVNLNLAECHTCLFVCSSWNSVFVKYVYKTVKNVRADKLALLMQNMAIYPRCMDAGKYIKCININRLWAAHTHIDKSSSINSFLSSIAPFTEVENLEMDCSPDMIKILLNPGMPELNRLKYLLCDRMFTVTTNDILKCYYKYRETLVFISLVSITHILCNLTPNCIISYLNSFAMLRTIQIEIPSAVQFDGHPTFHIITEQFADLSSIHYASHKLDLPDIDNTRSIRSCILSSCSLVLDSICPKTSLYLNWRLSQITKLNIIINNIDGDESRVINNLLSISTLVDFQLKIWNSHCKDALDTFWSHASLPSQPSEKGPQNKLSIIVDERNDNTFEFAFTRNIRSRIKSMSSELCFRPVNMNHAIIHYSEYLRGPGIYLGKLNIQDYTKHPQFNLQIVNEMCPALTNLNLANHAFSPTIMLIEPNLYLTTLSLNRCSFTTENTSAIQLTFKNIENAYPRLQNLSLSNIYFQESHEPLVYRLQLPETGLKTLSMFLRVYLCGPGSIIVHNEIEGIPRKSWYATSDSQMTTEYDNRDNSQEVSSTLTQPLFVLISSTIENVNITINDL
ncbi:hypothetical protein BDB01DRAFT_808715 [Pilobolus umbonatus]|nr:hypothetical protein BDB01DRAFT_808715 [Pilobolus umbonatus]